MTDLRKPDPQFPGWYEDPTREYDERFWDGRSWTANVRGDRRVVPPPVHRGPERRANWPPNGKQPAMADDRRSGVPSAKAGAANESSVASTAEAAETSAIVDRAMRTEAKSAAPKSAQPKSAEPKPAEPKPAALLDSEPSSESSDAGGGGVGNWLAVAVFGLALAVGGFFVGRAVANDDPADPAVLANASAEEEPAVDDGELQRANADLQASNDELVTANSELSDSVADLEERVTTLEGQLADSQEALAEAEAERDNLAEHNALLQSWFTPEVLARSQAEWDAEVARLCAAEQDPTVDDLRYTRRLEVIGTQQDLLDAAMECRAG